jgi:tetrahydromethanopterin S-methyltransferase subunit B
LSEEDEEQAHLGEAKPDESAISAWEFRKIIVVNMFELTEAVKNLVNAQKEMSKALSRLSKTLLTQKKLP